MKKDKTVLLAEKILSEHKAEDIETINVKERTPFADYYVLATATNLRHLKALCELVQDAFEKEKVKINHIEGKSETGWILIDAYYVIINIFTKEERERINISDLLSKQ